MTEKYSTESSGLILKQIINSLAGCQLIGIVPNTKTIRLDFITQHSLAQIKDFKIIRLVLEGHTNLFYRSYTEVAAHRTNLTDFNTILYKELFIQSAEETPLNSVIIYCNSLKMVEAGELHIHFTSFQFYDEHYGKLNNDLLRYLNQ